MGNLLGGYLFPHPPILFEEIGRGEQLKATKTIAGMNQLVSDIKDREPSTIILITPHGPIFRDGIAISTEAKLVGDFSRFGHSNLEYSFQNNVEMVQAIVSESLREDIPLVQISKESATKMDIEEKLDHGALVPLHFVNKEYNNYKLVHLTYGLLAPKLLAKFGELLAKVVEKSDEQVIIIASGDLSHKLSSEGPYNYSPYGKEFDEKIMDIIQRGSMEEIVNFDFRLADQAGECGLRSLIITAGALSNKSLCTQVVSYEGPFGIGYGTAKLIVSSEEDRYVKLAKASLEQYVRSGSYYHELSNLPKEMLENRNGVFVSLKKNGDLRGCIGTIEPYRENIAQEIIQNAVSAGIHDPRFDPVTEAELGDLVYSVDVLYPPEDITSKEELNVSKYGVIVSNGQRKGLLLPNLEGVDSVEEQIEISLMKAGIGKDENYSMQRFEVVRHK
ncbi:MAG: amrA [Firmicutes bacterium]|nr:amrA [Bacillota bacterium]